MSEASSSGERAWHVFEMDIALGCWSVAENENGDSFIAVEGFHSRRRDDVRLSGSSIPKVFLVGIRIYKNRCMNPIPFSFSPEMDEQGETIGTLAFFSPEAARATCLGGMEAHMTMNMESASWDRMARLAISGRNPPWNLRARVRFPATRVPREASTSMQGRLVEATFIYDNDRPFFRFHDVSGLVHSFLCQFFPPASTASTGSTPFTNAQFRTILLELTSSALSAYRNDGRSLEKGIEQARSIAQEVWDALQVIHAGNKEYRQSRKLAGPDILEGWKKRSPLKDLALGDESTSRVETSVDDFEYMAGIYFSSPLRSRMIEYIIIDGLMYAELQAFSKEIIRRLPGYLSYENSLPVIPVIEWHSLDKISKRLFWRRFPWTLAYWIGGFIAPFAYAIYAAGAYGWKALAGATLWSLAAELLRRTFKHLDLSGRQKEAVAFKSFMDTFSLMGKAYLQVNPHSPPEEIVPALNRSIDAGAAWSPLVFKIIRNMSVEADVDSSFRAEYRGCFRLAAAAWMDKNTSDATGSEPTGVHHGDSQ